MGDNVLTLYHGSDKIIEKPQYGAGNKFNDYGFAFYTTPIKELAAEWAVPTKRSDGYINAYTLNTDGLTIFDMDSVPFEFWISILIQNRGGKYSDVVKERQKKWIDKFPFSVDGFDIVKGWRADDSYFSFVRDFFDIGLSLENLSKAMKFGGLGVQYCLMTRKAISALEFVSPAHPVSAKVYYPKRQSRDDSVRAEYKDMQNKARGTILFDIIGRD